MKRLVKLISDAECIKENILSTVVLVVHESMHGSDVLAKIQTLCGIVAQVVPNNGTLSTEVAAEIQSIRKSRATGERNSFRKRVPLLTCV